MFVRRGKRAAHRKRPQTGAEAFRLTGTQGAVTVKRGEVGVAFEAQALLLLAPALPLGVPHPRLLRDGAPASVGGSHTVNYDTPGTYYYICDVSNHCND